VNQGQRNVRLFEIGRHYDLTSRKMTNPSADPHDRRDRRSAGKKSLRCRARIFLCRPQGDLDSIGELAGGFAWRDGGAECCTRRGAEAWVLGANELGSAGQLARRVAEKFKIPPGCFPCGIGARSAVHGVPCGRRSAAL